MIALEEMIWKTIVNPRIVLFDYQQMKNMARVSIVDGPVVSIYDISDCDAHG
jgi:hypothetical protein